MPSSSFSARAAAEPEESAWEENLAESNVSERKAENMGSEANASSTTTEDGDGDGEGDESGGDAGASGDDASFLKVESRWRGEGDLWTTAGDDIFTMNLIASSSVGAGRRSLGICCLFCFFSIFYYITSRPVTHHSPVLLW